MSFTPLLQRTAKFFAITGITIALLACASGKSGMTTSATLQPVPAQSTLVSDSLGSLAVLASPQLSTGAVTSVRMERLEAVGQDLQTVLRGLARNYGLNLQMEPEIKGVVNTSLRNVTLEEALTHIVSPQGYTWEIQDGVLRIAGARSQTRLFSLDYVSINRNGSSNTTVSRSFGGGGGGFTGGSIGGGGGGGGNTINTSTVADLWQEIRVGLEGLIFDDVVTGNTASSTGQLIQAAPTNNNLQTPGNFGVNGFGMQGGGASAYSHQAAGRRLIINPMAGTIMVTAPPAKLNEVAQYISGIESSVLRQVLIEAKIVEVVLTRDTQFGIDWNSVMKIKNLNLGIAQTLNSGGTGSGISLSLSGGSTQISAVLRALQTQGEVNILDAPRLSALNNQPAIFRVTTEEVVFNATRQPILGPNGGTIGFNTTINPQQVSVGIVLSVVPQIGSNNTITMSVQPHVNNVARVASITLEDGSTAQAPVLEEREVDTMVRTRAGETVVIGGLMQNKVTKDRSGVPGLRSVPLFGKLFESRHDVLQKSELVIFLTATIVASQPPGGAQ